MSGIGKSVVIILSTDGDFFAKHAIGALRENRGLYLSGNRSEMGACQNDLKPPLSHHCLE